MEKDLFHAHASEVGTKVNTTGQYTVFQGSTIVMPLAASSRDTMQQLYQQLASDPLVTQSLALLPTASYHVTLRGIKNCCQYTSALDYNHYIDAYFERMVALEKAFAREGGVDEIAFTVLPPRSRRPLVFLEAQDGEVEYSLRRWETQADEALQLHDEAQEWHLTLGYW
jgi:hypothetical protein